MNRLILFLVVAVALSGICAAPAAADVYPWYYHDQPASWQATDPPEPTATVSPRQIVSEPKQPVQLDQGAFVEKQPLVDMTSKDVLDTPIQIGGVDDGCCQADKGGKGGKGGGGGWCPCWQFTVDGLVLRREHTPGVSLSHRTGLRLGAVRSIDCCRDIEFSFFYVDQWSHVAPAVQYGTDLYSWELNYRRAWGCGRVKTLIGIRLMELDENRTIPAAGVVEDIDNHLIGVQVGAEVTLVDCNRLEIEAGTKVGIYHNNADYDATGLIATLGADHTAFAGELWLGADYCVTSCLDLRAGYQMMWIEGVTDITTMSPAAVALDMGGSPFYHGFYVGGQLNW